MDRYLCWIFMLASVAVATASQMLLKQSARKTYSSTLREYLNPFVIFGYALMVASTLLAVFAYKFGLNYKEGPVIESVGYILIMLLSYLFFKEKITWKKALGNAVVICGIVVFYI